MISPSSELALTSGVAGKDAMEEAADEDQVVLSSIHQSKGREWRALFVLGLVLALGGLLAGSNRVGTSIRGYLRHGLEGAGAQAALRVDALAPVGAWVGRYQTALRWASVVLGGVVLFWGLAPTAGRVWGSAALVAALVAVISLLVGAATPAAAPEQAPTLAPTG